MIAPTVATTLVSVSLPTATDGIVTWRVAPL